MVSNDSLACTSSLHQSISPHPRANLEAGSSRLGCGEPRGSTALPPWLRDVIVISHLETEAGRNAEEVAALFLLPRVVGSNSSQGWKFR